MISLLNTDPLNIKVTITEQDFRDVQRTIAELKAGDSMQLKDKKGNKVTLVIKKHE